MCFTQFSPMLHHRMFLLQATLKLMVKYLIEKFCQKFRVWIESHRIYKLPGAVRKKNKPHRTLCVQQKFLSGTD